MKPEVDKLYSLMDFYKEVKNMKHTKENIEDALLFAGD